MTKYKPSKKSQFKHEPYKNLDKVTPAPTDEEIASRPHDWFANYHRNHGKNIFVSGRLYNTMKYEIWEILPESRPPTQLYLHSQTHVALYNLKHNTVLYYYDTHGAPRDIVTIRELLQTPDTVATHFMPVSHSKFCHWFTSTETRPGLDQSAPPPSDNPSPYFM